LHFLLLSKDINVQVDIMIPTELLAVSISLRLKCIPTGPPLPPPGSESLTDQIQVMAKQESGRYHCQDYLHKCIGPMSEDCPSLQHEEAVDAPSRKKMIDWMYRVVDHYCINREVVATATSNLDRFVDQCTCDRTAFKLAAMTSLYLSSKVHDHSRLSLLKLADLSRGEFTIFDIEEMEATILQTLGWRVNPVTAQSFIHSLLSLVPISNSLVSRAIYDRALFFTELCLFDGGFITRKRSIIAVAAILNAMEGIDEYLVPLECEKKFLASIESQAGLSFSYDEVESAREDLWFIYSRSAQYQEDDMQMMPTEPTDDATKAKHDGIRGQTAHIVSRSPVSVVNRK
jgi:hypothetical protein